MGHQVYRPLTQPLIHSDYKKPAKTVRTNPKNFALELQSALKPISGESLTISKHARHRLEQRGINFNEARWNQIGEKVKEAKTMGVKESLVLVDDAALIVSAQNNTVITAMNRAEASKQIFTNINGTILMD
jgi:flagellar operon protein